MSSSFELLGEMAVTRRASYLFVNMAFIVANNAGCP